MAERRLGVLPPGVESLRGADAHGGKFGRWESTAPLAVSVAASAKASPMNRVQGAAGSTGNGDESPSHAALVHSSAGISGVVDLVGSGDARVINVDSSTNLIAPRTLIPGVRSEVQGETWLASRVWGVPKKGMRDGWVDEWDKAVGEGYASGEEVVKALELEL